MHTHALFKYRYMLGNYQHYQSVSLTSTPAGMCTPNVEFWGQLGMQSIYGQQLTHHVLLFNTMQCQQEKAVTLLHTVNVIGHHRVFVINVYIIQSGTEYNLK